MEEVSILELEKKVARFASSGAKWHFHMLPSGCMYNERPQNAFIVEDVSEDLSYIGYSVEPQLELSNKLTHILESSHIIENLSEYKLTEEEIGYVAHARELVKTGKDWHYHVLQPQCIYNEKQSKWMFVFESEEMGDVTELAYETEPALLARELELLKDK